MPVGVGAPFILKVVATHVGMVSFQVYVMASGTLDSNSADSRATATTIVQGRCAPRPRVSVAAIRTGNDRLRVTITSNSDALTPDNRLLQLRATIPPNARVDLDGGASDLAGVHTLSLGSHAQSLVFTLRRVGAGHVHLPLVIVDECGEWSTFVGGGI
jgi:hypothetical protein